MGMDNETIKKKHKTGGGAILRLAEQPRFEPKYKYDEIIIPLQHGQVNEALAFCERNLNFDAEFELTLKQRKKKRSLDANRLLWELCEKLAEVQETPHTKEDIYRELVRDYGVFNILPLKDSAKDRWIEEWENRGLGWICESLGKSKFEGYENIVSYYGSSVYDTKEMKRLLDAAVAACKEQGIETLPPNEIADLEQNWGL